MYNPLMEAWIEALGTSDCHDPRIVLAPSIDQQFFPDSGKITYNFHLVPGSIIWGLFPMTSGELTMQLTDIEIGHALFQEPVQCAMLLTRGVFEGRFPSYLLLPSPWPVVGDGLFTLEVWGPPASRFYMLLGVAEVSVCPPTK
jgi:hypothetical protein